MFRKFQEYTLDFFYGEEPKVIFSSRATFWFVIYILIIVADAMSCIVCTDTIYKNGLTVITVPWLVVSIIFWVTLILTCLIPNENTVFNKRLYCHLTTTEKRYIFKLSVLLFFHFASCGIMFIVLPFMILIEICNKVIDRVSKIIFPEPVQPIKKKSNKKLSNEFDLLIKKRKK